ncbi:hypothetical protein R0J90_14760, partial [Micrococcus sp. SIMBA_144]
SKTSISVEEETKKEKSISIFAILYKFIFVKGWDISTDNIILNINRLLVWLVVPYILYILFK